MSFEINGRLAEKYETQKVSDRFQKREFVLEVKSSSATGFEFVDFIKFQSTQDKCSMLDDLSYFTNLEAWRIEKLSNETTESAAPVQDKPESQDAPFPSNPPENDSGFDDLPF